MNIQLTDAGKRFRFDWIFRQLHYQFEAGGRYAILGPNGSGKSTLMKVLCGHLSLSRGEITFKTKDQTLDADTVYKQVSFAAPYIELIEELSLAETLRFHTRLKPLLPGLNPDSLYELLELPRTRHKELRFFSSGMKQRVKLALAICSDTPVVLLDEPSTNLDIQAVEWYKNLVDQYLQDRMLLLASNDPGDLDLCEQQLNILDYKTKR